MCLNEHSLAGEGRQGCLGTMRSAEHGGGGWKKVRLGGGLLRATQSPAGSGKESLFFLRVMVEVGSARRDWLDPCHVGHASEGPTGTR